MSPPKFVLGIALRVDANLLPWTRRETSELKHFKDEKHVVGGRAVFLENMYVKVGGAKGISPIHPMVNEERETFNTPSCLSYI